MAALTAQAEHQEPHKFSDARDRVVERAMAAGIKYEFVPWSDAYPGSDPFALSVLIPNGKSFRSVTLDPADAEEFVDTKFEKFQVLGPEYRSIYFAESDRVELMLEPILPEVAQLSDLLRVPGVELFDKESGLIMPGGIENKAVSIRQRKGLLPNRTMVFVNGINLDSEKVTCAWRLPIPGGPKDPVVELSSASEEFLKFAGRWSVPESAMMRITLKLARLPKLDYDGMLEEVESIAESLFFELDIRFNINLSLLRRFPDQKREIDFGKDLKGQPPVRFPRLRYPKTATTLYSYGKSLSEAPLNRYLALYQSIEYFFPMFIGREAMQRVRRALNDARFNVRSDDDIQRLIRLASRGTIKDSNERGQLLAAIQNSIEDHEIEVYLEGMTESERAFLAEKKNGLKGITPLLLASNVRLTEQVKDRVYLIRNRIVHAKDSRSEEFVEPLLPFSSESRRLGPDLKLLEMLSQRIIIAGSG